jgi:hypothetical protein
VTSVDPAPPEPTAAADEWLRRMHSAYMDRFLADNQRIWMTASIFVPLSLTPFAVLFSIKEPRSVHVIVLAGVSLTLLGFWSLVARRHRAFQAQSLTTVIAIEARALRGTDHEDLLETAHRRTVRGAGPRVGLLRVVLLAVVATGWIAVFIVFLAGGLG